MKKIVSFALICIVFLCLTACSNMPDTSTEIENSEKLLLSALDGTRSFITQQGVKHSIKDYKLGDLQNIDVIPTEYSFVDLDQDGSNELVAYVSPDYGAYVVFRYYEGEIYCYDFNARSLISLKADGSFMQSSTSGINSFVSLSFNDKEYTIITNAEADTIQNLYRIAGSEVTKEDFNTFADEWYSKSGATWTPITVK